MIRDDVANALIAIVLRREGGITELPGEGYVTRYGQTPAWLEQFGLPAPKTRDEAAANYRRWLDVTGLIEVCDQLDALADAVIDFAVHSDHRRAIRAVQGAVGTRPDGVIGPDTIHRLVDVDRRALAARVIADRVAFLLSLFAENPDKYTTFARGWGHRMREQIRGLA